MQTDKLVPVVYIAGPFRGPSSWAIEENIRHAERLALEVWKLGCAALCPHCNTRFFQGAAPDDVWLFGDLALLAKSDAVLMTDNWQRSSGARSEHDFAQLRDIPILYTLNGLKRWFEKEWNHVTA